MTNKSYVLFFPVLLLFLCSGFGMYWHQKIASQIPIAEAKLSKLQSVVQLIDCPTLNKQVVISNARELVEQDNRIAEVYFLMGLLFFMIGIVNTTIVLRYLKNESK